MFEPALHGVARLVPFRVVGLGVRAPVLGRNDYLDALPRELGAEGVAAIGPVGNQAGQRRVRPRFHQGPGLGAVVGAGRPSRARQHVDLGTEAAPATVEGGIHPFVFGCARRAHVRAHDRAGQQRGGQIRIGL